MVNVPHASRFRWISTVSLFLLLASSGCGTTPAEYLRQAEAPAFKAGHRLPPLTRWGWDLSVDARMELAERWGYALAFGTATAEKVESLESADCRGGAGCPGALPAVGADLPGTAGD